MMHWCYYVPGVVWLGLFTWGLERNSWQFYAAHGIAALWFIAAELARRKWWNNKGSRT